MLSRDCDGCSQLHLCSQRYQTVKEDGRVYCPDGTAHLVDASSIPQDADMRDQYQQCSIKFHNNQKKRKRENHF